jgi:peptide/nickel transport system permease protein
MNTPRFPIGDAGPSPAGSEVVSAAQAPRARNQRRGQVVRAVLRRPASAVSVGFVALLLLLAFVGPLVAPYNPDTQNLANAFASPSWTHLFGTDDFGRDVASRIIVASRITILAPVISVGIAVLIGLPLGLLAAVRGGWVDSTTSRLADTVLALPALVGALAIVAILGPGLVTTMIAVGIIFSPTMFRVVRGAAVSVAEETFVRSATAIGASQRRILAVHVLPNIAAPLMVQVTILMGVALLVEASLSFLGLGVQPPDASWGSMLKAAYASQFKSPFAVVPPGLAMLLTVLAFNTIGDAIRDAIGVRRRA